MCIVKSGIINERDSDEILDIRNSKYQKYLIARMYRPALVKQKFHSVKYITRSNVFGFFYL